MGDLRHGIRFKTPRRANVFEHWLSENCTGNVELVVEDFSIEGVEKKLAVFFEKQLDMQAFKKAYSTI
jgi:hypothetical protein|tara:strand:- start:3254 stop:3457 length:204 start_codon:yes stop_codon:yes gene_type:complete